MLQVKKLPQRNPILRNFWTRPARIRVLRGGRASGKTIDAGAEAILLARTYKIKMLCTRRQQNRISESVYTVLVLEIERRGALHEFKITDNSIKHKYTGSEFIFMGIQRNLKEIKGLEGLTHVWLEEAEELSQEEFDIIAPTVRSDLSEFWIIFNPRFVSDYVWKEFVLTKHDDCIEMEINYDKNPYLSSTIKKDIAKMQAADPDRFRHIYGGQPRTDDEAVIIKLSWIYAAIDAHVKLGFGDSGARRVGFDVADDGDDLNANAFAAGSVVHWCDMWKGGEDQLLQSASRTYDAAVHFNAEIFYDCIGVGASAGAKFKEINEAKNMNVIYSKFNAGAKVVNPDQVYLEEGGKITNQDFFSNLKSQTWWAVATRFRNTYDAITNGTQYPEDQLISISSSCPNLELLKAELSTPRRHYDANGRVKVESKQDLKKRKVKSPNLADAFVMCFAPQERRPVGLMDLDW